MLAWMLETKRQLKRDIPEKIEALKFTETHRWTSIANGTACRFDTGAIAFEQHDKTIQHPSSSTYIAATPSKSHTRSTIKCFKNIPEPFKPYSKSTPSTSTKTIQTLLKIENPTPSTLSIQTLLSIFENEIVQLFDKTIQLNITPFNCRHPNSLEDI